MRWLLVLLLAGCTAPIRSTAYPEDIRPAVSHGWSFKQVIIPGHVVRGPNGKVRI